MVPWRVLFAAISPERELNRIRLAIGVGSRTRLLACCAIHRHTIDLQQERTSQDTSPFNETKCGDGHLHGSLTTPEA